MTPARGRRGDVNVQGPLLWWWVETQSVALTVTSSLDSLPVMRSDQLAYRPVSSTRRYVEVALQILEGIGSGATPLGSRLPSDRELAGMMGVSRPTVREAVLALEVLGVLQVRSGDGTYVVHDGVRSSRLGGLLSHKNFPVPATQVLEARRGVEPAATTLAAARATPEQVEELAALLDEAEKLAERVHDLGPFVQAGLRFHVVLARFCGNAHLSNFVEALVDIEQNPMWTLLNAHAMQSSKARAEQIAEHREILAAVRTHDADWASSLMRDHLGHLAASVETLKLGSDQT